MGLLDHLSERALDRRLGCVLPDAQDLVGLPIEAVVDGAANRRRRGLDRSRLATLTRREVGDVYLVVASCHAAALGQALPGWTRPGRCWSGILTHPQRVA